MSRYSSSQDHLIITLNEQIQAIMPLKESYSSLQRYHIKLNNDLDTIMRENRQMNETFGNQATDLAMANEELDFQKTRMIEELRALENEAAKINLDKKNLMAACETFSSKCNLENQHSLSLQNRYRDTLESIKKTEQNISYMKKLIAEIETEVKLKQSENSELRYEITRRSETNSQLQATSDNLENKIHQTGASNQDIVSQIRQLEKLVNQSELQVRQQFRNGKECSERYLRAKEKLCNLNHQKQYYIRLIESQLLNQEDLEISESKLKTIIERRQYEVNKMQSENVGLKQKIHIQREVKQKQWVQKEKLEEHLAELIKTNTLLLENMERSCSEDRKVHQILSEKFDKLENVCNKVRRIGTNNVVVVDNYQQEIKSRILKDIANHQANQKQNMRTRQTTEKSSKTWWSKNSAY